MAATAGPLLCGRADDREPGPPPRPAKREPLSAVWWNHTVKRFVPWLTVLALIVALNALRLRPLATAVAVAWLIYCVWTWVRPGRPTRNDNRAG